jgi:hypothetical protein
MELPNTAIHVLSIGRAFVDNEVVAAWAGIRHPNLTVGIPIYAAVDHIHDHAVQARGAFDETVLGVLKLKDKGHRVEIRVVLHALTAPRIVETCKWFARNLPFVDHPRHLRWQIRYSQGPLEQYGFGSIQSIINPDLSNAMPQVMEAKIRKCQLDVAGVPMPA